MKFEALKYVLALLQIISLSLEEQLSVCTQNKNATVLNESYRLLMEIHYRKLKLSL